MELKILGYSLYHMLFFVGGSTLHLPDMNFMMEQKKSSELILMEYCIMLNAFFLDRIRIIF